MSAKVSVGIPTYNRCDKLKKAVASVLEQDYPNIQLIVSDNNSSDETEEYCRALEKEHNNFVYLRQEDNHGAIQNFQAVFDASDGEYFLWLGDDDRIDSNYISLCIQELEADPKLSLVYGRVKYYRNNQLSYEGKSFDLLQRLNWLRIFIFYARVSENGMFFGLFRSEQLRGLPLRPRIGCDWFLLSAILTFGSARFIEGSFIHRDLGGASESFEEISKALKISNSGPRFPFLDIAKEAYTSIHNDGPFQKNTSAIGRFIGSLVVFMIVLNKKIIMRFVLKFNSLSQSQHT